MLTAEDRFVCPDCGAKLVLHEATNRRLWFCVVVAALFASSITRSYLPDGTLRNVVWLSSLILIIVLSILLIPSLKKVGEKTETPE